MTNPRAPSLPHRERGRRATGDMCSWRDPCMKNSLDARWSHRCSSGLVPWSMAVYGEKGACPRMLLPIRGEGITLIRTTEGP